jgi:hypothetical protein
MRFCSMRAAGVLALAAGLVSAGCSGGPTFAEVIGTVKVGGKPMENVQVEFWPEVTGPRSIGVTDRDGRFTLRTQDGKQAGAVIGPHKVVLVDLSTYAKIPLNRSRQVENVDFSPKRFAGRYGDPNHTPLKKEVKAGEANTFDLSADP